MFGTTSFLNKASLALLALVSSAATLAPAAHSQASIQGRIESFEGPSRLARPKSGGAPASKIGKPDMKGLSLKSGTTGSILSSDNFKFGKASSDVANNLLPARDLRKGGTSQTGDVDENSKELTVAWDEWHKRVISALYQRWKETHGIAGQAKVSVVVSREGDLDISMEDFEQPEDASYESGTEESFKHAVRSTVNTLLHSSILEFPALSQRKNVKLVTTFAMNMLGPSGYSYKHGDVEKVKMPSK